jgi:hypothetical protein
LFVSSNNNLGKVLLIFNNPVAVIAALEVEPVVTIFCDPKSGSIFDPAIAAFA